MQKHTHIIGLVSYFVMDQFKPENAHKVQPKISNKLGER